MPSARPPLSWDDVRYFLEVAEVGTITRAAERLGIRQPSLSAAMQRLERRLGCELLLRSKTGVELTRRGRLLAARGRAFLSQWDALEDSVVREGEEPAGRFTIGCHVSIAAHWLPRTLPAMLARWPRLELSVVHELSRRVNDLVVSHELDFGLVVNPLRHPDLVVHELATDVFTAWGRGPGYADTVLYDPDLLQAQSILRQLQRRGVRFRRSVTSSSLELLARLAAQGAGTAILPTHLAERTRPALRRPTGDAPSVLDSVCLVYRADAQRTAAARALVQALKAARPHAG
jgi:DNA-binding transcriptional LysR family regulator